MACSVASTWAVAKARSLARGTPTSGMASGSRSTRSVAFSNSRAGNPKTLGATATITSRLEKTFRADSVPSGPSTSLVSSASSLSQRTLVGECSRW